MSTCWIEDNYPTEECLEYLKECPASEAFEILRENWWPLMVLGYNNYIAIKAREKTLVNAHGQTIRFCNQDCKVEFLNQEGFLTA